MVIDADALNMLSLNQELLQLIPEESVLTPHPKEFERIAGGWRNDFEKLELLRSFSIKLKSIIILKGAYTAIACPNGNVFFNSTGNPGMAKGGTGDVLTGVRHRGVRPWSPVRGQIDAAGILVRRLWPVRPHRLFR